MGLRTIVLTLFVIGVLILLHRQRSTHSQTIHSPAPPAKLSSSQNERPFYGIGSYNNIQTPKIGLLDLLTRKKINNYVFNHYNQYRIQIALVDFGYTSLFQFHFFSEDNGGFSLQEKIGFDLPERLDQNVDIFSNKKKFSFSMKTNRDTANHLTTTTFNITSHRKLSNLTLNLTHIRRDNDCFTAIRTGDIISHKCYGGNGQGKLRIQRFIKQQQTKRNSIFNPTFNLTRCAFDGLRGSSLHWKWTWGLLSGFSKPQFYAKGHKIEQERYLAVNFGSINGESEDFAFINGKVYPIQGLKYELDEKFQFQSVIQFQAQSPKMQFNFTIIQRNQMFNDMGVIKQDMIKADGHWAGWIMDEDGTKIQFYLLSGLVQTCDSLF